MSELTDRAKLLVASEARRLYFFNFDKSEIISVYQEEHDFVFLRSRKVYKDVVDELGNPTGETRSENEPIVFIETRVDLKTEIFWDNIKFTIPKSRIVVICPRLFVLCKDGKAVNYSGEDVTSDLPVTV